MARSDRRAPAGGRFQVFLLTCAAGFEQIVASALVDDVDRLKVHEVTSGMLLVKAPSTTAKRLANAPYLSGAHQVLAQISTKPTSINEVLQRFASMVQEGRAERFLFTARSFRIRAIDEGQPVSVGRAERAALERAVARWSGMRVEPSGSTFEVWVYQRRADTRAWLTLRLDNPSRRRSQAGALKLEVASALARVAPIGPKDVFLDPFAGSGAVSAARALYPHTRIILSDADPETVEALRARRRHGDFGPRSEVVQSYVEDLVPEPVERGSVDVAILDPPWGLFDRSHDNDDLILLYQRALRTVEAALRSGGWCVLLVANPELIDVAAWTSHLAVEEVTPVLVNGRKASVLRMRRAAAGAA